MTAKLVLAMFLSLDGYAQGPNGILAPPPMSDDLARRWSAENLARAAHLLYGRVNFFFNKAFWTSAAAAAQAETARINALPKTVVSRSLAGDPGWNGVVQHDLAGAVAALKASVVDGDIYSFGGANLAQSLMGADLIDEYRLMLTPTLLGDGERLFETGRPRVDLKLVEALTLDTGVMILRYCRR